MKTPEKFYNSFSLTKKIELGWIDLDKNKTDWFKIMQDYSDYVNSEINKDLIAHRKMLAKELEWRQNIVQEQRKVDVKLLIINEQIKLLDKYDDYVVIQNELVELHKKRKEIEQL